MVEPQGMASMVSREKEQRVQQADTQRALTGTAEVVERETRAVTVAGVAATVQTVSPAIPGTTLATVAKAVGLQEMRR